MLGEAFEHEGRHPAMLSVLGLEDHRVDEAMAGGKELEVIALERRIPSKSPADKPAFAVGTCADLQSVVTDIEGSISPPKLAAPVIALLGLNAEARRPGP